MAQGPDDGDEEELVDIELEVELDARLHRLSWRPRVAVGRTGHTRAGCVETSDTGPDLLPDIVEVRQPMGEAAAAGPAPTARSTMREAEAATARTRQAVLLLPSGPAWPRPRPRRWRWRGGRSPPARGSTPTLWPLRPAAHADRGPGKSSPRPTPPRRRRHRRRGPICWSSAGGSARIAWGGTPTRSRATATPWPPRPIIPARCWPCCSRARGWASPRSPPRRWRGWHGAVATPTRRARSRLRPLGPGAPAGRGGGAARALAILDGELAQADAATPVGTLLSSSTRLTDVATRRSRRRRDASPRRDRAPRGARRPRSCGRPAPRAGALAAAEPGTPAAALALSTRRRPSTAGTRWSRPSGWSSPPGCLRLRHGGRRSPRRRSRPPPATTRRSIRRCFTPSCATRAGRGAAAATSLEAPRVAGLQARARICAPLRWPRRRSSETAPRLPTGSRMRRPCAGARAGRGRRAGGGGRDPAVAARRRGRGGGLLPGSAGRRPGHRPALRALAGLLSREARAPSWRAARGRAGDRRRPGQGMRTSSGCGARWSRSVPMSSASPGARCRTSGGWSRWRQTRFAARARLHDLELAAGVDDLDNVLALADRGRRSRGRHRAQGRRGAWPPRRPHRRCRRPRALPLFEVAASDRAGSPARRWSARRDERRAGRADGVRAGATADAPATRAGAALSPGPPPRVGAGATRRRWPR